jgi:predicted benzoate:H+ symporter BenE
MDNLSELHLTAANVSFLDPSSIKEVSSLASIPNMCPFTSFWTSPEAVLLFKSVDDQSFLEAIDN